MKIIFSGLDSRERLQVVLAQGVESLFLDYSLASNLNQEELAELHDQVSFLGLDFDLSKKWSQVKTFWGDTPSEKKLAKFSSLDEAKDSSLQRLDGFVSQYAEYANEVADNFDVVMTPYLPIDHNLEWEKLLKSQNRGVTIKSLEYLERKIPEYSFIGISKEIDDEELFCKITSCIASLRAFSCKLHGWGRVTKKDAVRGLLWSSSTSNWLSGGRYGNTYEYVGNLKLNLYHGSKGAGKQARNKLKTKCLDLGIDHQRLLEDDRKTVDAWNLSQWIIFASDAEKVSTYLDERERENTTTALKKSEPKTLAHASSFGAYLRDCNSCFLSSQCPLFEVDAQCKVPGLPEIKTPDDVSSLLNKVIQLQGERVLFSAFAEKVQNVGINPEVSKELETLTKLMKDAKEITRPVESDEVMIRAKGSGVISKLFGSYGRTSGGTKPSTSEKIIDISPLEQDDE